MSDDGQFAVVAIALVGSPFSSTYARTGHSPLQHCALNVALYGPGGSAWSLTERSIRPSHRESDGIAIGPSSMRWERDALVVSVEEKRAPFGRALRGSIRLEPEVLSNEHVALDPAHTWWPVAPVSRIAVDLDGVRFSGHGYHDANAGDAPLASAFSRWTWSRARLPGDRAVVAYDVIAREGTAEKRAFSIDRTGMHPIDVLGASGLSRTRWGIARTARGDRARVVRDLEDTPFYARALVESRVLGEDVRMMHETLSCERLASSWVRFLLPFRTRRG